MPPTLEGVRSKRNRAEYYLKLIEQCVTEFFNSNPYPLSIEAHPERGIYHARLINPKELPAIELGLMIGDCIHNMRSSLDYIAWELAGANIRDTTTMFPIFDDETRFKKHGAWRIKNIPHEPRAFIEKIQPYKSGAKALMAIENLDTADKHQLLTVIVPVSKSFTGIGIGQAVQNGDHTFSSTSEPNVRLIHNAIIATFTIIPPIPNMKVEFQITPQIAFGEHLGFSLSHSVVPNLKALLLQTDIVIEKLSPFFDASAVKG